LPLPSLPWRRFRHLPVKMLRGVYGNPTFRDVLAHLRCSKCGGPPAPVYLVAGHHRTFCHGPEPDWAVELIPAASYQGSKLPRQQVTKITAQIIHDFGWLTPTSPAIPSEPSGND